MGKKGLLGHGVLGQHDNAKCTRIVDSVYLLANAMLRSWSLVNVLSVIVTTGPDQIQNESPILSMPPALIGRDLDPLPHKRLPIFFR
jgi:hypothetical protein